MDDRMRCPTDGREYNMAIPFPCALTIYVLQVCILNWKLGAAEMK